MWVLFLQYMKEFRCLKWERYVNNVLGDSYIKWSRKTLFASYQLFVYNFLWKENYELYLSIQSWDIFKDWIHSREFWGEKWVLFH